MLVECTACKRRWRVDGEPEPQHSAAGGARDCPHCRATGTVTAPREFNLLFRTTAGPTASGHEVYLRPETAQGIFLLFAPTLVATRRRLPFGLGQVGRSFRNEVSPANFLFRMREFEQMELEYFCRAEEAPRHYAEWVAFCERWLRTLGIREGSVRRVEHAPGDLAHYARACTDLEFLYPHGWGELWGVAHRGDYDLQQHQQGSGADLRYTDPDTGEKVLPHVVEPAVGLDRLMYAVLTDAYTEDRVGGEPRILLRLPRPLAPYPLAVLPLLRRADMVQAAAAVQARLPGADLDVTGSIGKRYRRQDEIGTPYCATVDERTLADGTVTLRDRDSTRQIRLHVDELVVRMRDPDFVFAFPDSAAVSGAASVAQ